MVVAKSIIEKGVHEWPWVGASFYNVEQPFREDIFGGAGVVISQVWNDSPAARAGLQTGTAVLEVDGMAVQSEQDIERIIYNKSVGDPVKFLFQIKEKEQLEIELLLEEFPGMTGLAVAKTANHGLVEPQRNEKLAHEPFGRCGALFGFGAVVRVGLPCCFVSQ